MTTDVQTFIADLDGGVLAEKLAHAISKVAAGVIDHDKAGKISLDFSLKRIGSSYQVSIEHTLTYQAPTSKGHTAEKNTTSTPMHVGKGGRVTLFPENQVQMFDKLGNPAISTTQQG